MGEMQEVDFTHKPSVCIVLVSNMSATYFTFSNQTKLNQSIIIIYLPIFPCVQHTSLYTTAAPPFSSLKPASNRLHRTINSIRHHHGVTFLMPINQWHVYWLWLMHFGGLDQVNKWIFIWTCWKINDAFLRCIPSLLCHATSLKRHAGHMVVSRPRVIGDASSDIKTAGVPKLISPVNSNEGGGGLCYASRRFSLRRVRNTLLIASCALNPSPDSQDSDCMSRALRCGTEVLWVTAQTNANRVNRDPTNSTATGVSVWSQKHTSRSFEGYSIHLNYYNNNTNG